MNFYYRFLAKSTKYCHVKFTWYPVDFKSNVIKGFLVYSSLVDYWSICEWLRCMLGCIYKNLFSSCGERMTSRGVLISLTEIRQNQTWFCIRWCCEEKKLKGSNICSNILLLKNASKYIVLISETIIQSQNARGDEISKIPQKRRKIWMEKKRHPLPYRANERGRLGVWYKW